MKFLGFILVTLSSAVCGLCYCSSKTERLDDLRSFCLMLELIGGEITNKLSPIPEIAHEVSEKISGKARSFLKLIVINLSFVGEKNFESIWCECFVACGAEFDSKEVEVILNLGKVLGRYDVQTQHEAIQSALVSLHSAIEKESAELPQLKKLSVSLSMSVGAFLAILLV